MKGIPLRSCGLASSLVLISAVWVGCGRQGPAASSDPFPAKSEPPQTGTSQPARVREPAVAGLFYPKEPGELARMIDACLAAAPLERAGELKAIICPHAGYAYSGPTAAHAYKLLVGRSYAHVIVLAPSHYARFDGASVLAADVFRTPLGDVPVSEKGRELVKLEPFIREPRCRVQRPPWAAQSSRSMPAPGEETPDTWEHSDEVQVPFLQRVLGDFKLLTVVLGEANPAEVARGLGSVLDEQTLLVVSSDLSHYHPYEQARLLDLRCVQAICDLDLDQMQNQEACGKAPILALLRLAREKGWKTRKLDYRNSGDTAGQKGEGVVGYAAIAFFSHEDQKGNHSTKERRFLIDLAKRTVREVVTGGGPFPADPDTIEPRLREHKGCFVTLTRRGQLRGCIGHIFAQEPLYQAVRDNARSAALEDARFPPVQPEELSELEFEISILTEPEPLTFRSPEELLAQLRPYQDGVVLRLGERGATFLPQVWEQLPDKVQFLNRLALKAGGGESDWRRPGTTVSIYQVEAFKEADL